MGVETELNALRTGGANFFKATAAASINLTSVRNVAATLSGGYLRNRSAAEKYVKFYNKASAPVVASDVPVITVGIPAAGFINIGDLVGWGMRFSIGIAFAITGAYADADATAVAAADVDVNLIYT
jgi:hypothetical protein